MNKEIILRLFIFWLLLKMFKDLFTEMVTATYSVIPKSQNHLKCPVAGSWLKVYNGQHNCEMNLEQRPNRSKGQYNSMN